MKILIPLYDGIFLGAFAKFRKVTISFFMSVHMEQHGTPGSILIKFDTWLLFKKLSRKFKFH
jgi:hypothetical protein